jgi:hypothetical protein
VCKVEADVRRAAVVITPECSATFRKYGGYRFDRSTGSLSVTIDSGISHFSIKEPRQMTFQNPPLKIQQSGPEAMD